MKRELERLRDKLTPEEDRKLWSQLRGALREGREKKSPGHWLTSLHGRYAIAATAAVVVLVVLVAGFGPQWWNQVEVPVDRVEIPSAVPSGEKRGKGIEAIAEVPIAREQEVVNQVGEAQADLAEQDPAEQEATIEATDSVELPFIEEMVADVTASRDEGKKAHVPKADAAAPVPETSIAAEPGSAWGVIAGEVRDAVTADPLHLAYVFVRGESLGVETRVDGSFRIENVPEGMHRLIVQMRGYGDQRVDSVEVDAGFLSDVTIGMITPPDTGSVIEIISPRVAPNTIAGRVVDRATGRPLYPANVLVFGEAWGTMTREDGSFKIRNVPPGDYQLLVQMMGYADQTARDVQVSEAQGATVEFDLDATIALELGSIEVRGTRPHLDVTETACRMAMSRVELKDLPVDDVAEARSLQAGVIAKGGKLDFRGGRESQVKYQVDGVPVRDPRVRVNAQADAEAPSPTAIYNHDRSAGKRVVANHLRSKQGTLREFGEATWGGIKDFYDGSREEHRSRTGGTATVNAELADDMFFEHAGVNPFIDAAEDALSTFGLDVDTGSYTICRRYLNEGSLPPEAAVRVEEFINYFTHDYAPPTEDDFRIHIAGMPSPFAHVDDGSYWLLRIGVRGRVVAQEERKPAQIALVIDTSGSMREGRRLELVKDALSELIDELRPSDRVGIVTFGSAGRVVLPMQKVRSGHDLQRAIDHLRPNGSTNAAQGLELGYEMLRENARRDWIHRVIFLSDGVANQDITGFDEILDWVRRDSDQITLTTIGVGMGNYNDVLMERLADAGDGQYAYVDDYEEALRVLRDNLTGTLEIIARNTKAQIEFDPERVVRYRLLGYENRAIRDQDFRNDRVDAGEIGAGHEVTVLYEVKLAPEARGGRLAEVRLRYEIPFEDDYIELEESVEMDDLTDSIDEAPADLVFDACVAEFAEILRGSYWAHESTCGDVLDLLDELPREMRRRDEIREFIRLVERAEDLERE